MWERLTIKKTVGQISFGRCRKGKGKTEQRATGNRRRRVKKSLELVRHSSGLRFQGILVRRAYDAEKSGDWENCLAVFLKDDRLNTWQV